MQGIRVLSSFAFVGVIGFLVDAGVLYLLKSELGLYAGRGVSFLCAAGTTWVLNRLFTFSDRRSSLSTWIEAGSYILLMIIGGTINYAVYAALISNSDLVLSFPVIGVAAGSLSGLFVNLFTARFFLFRHGRLDQSDPVSPDPDKKVLR